MKRQIFNGKVLSQSRLGYAERRLIPNFSGYLLLFMINKRLLCDSSDSKKIKITRVYARTTRARARGKGQGNKGTRGLT